MSVIDPARIRALNEAQPREGKYVLYWMQQSQRARYNHALEFAVEQANDMGVPVVVGFGLTPNYPEANERHYAFMLEGLAETARDLERRDIRFFLQLGDPADVALALSADACVLVCDRGYLRHQKQWREKVAANAKCAVFQVESDVVVPVEAASDKAEFAARTLRPKIHRVLDKYLVPMRTVKARHSSLALKMESEPLDDIERLLQKLNVDRSVKRCTRIVAGPGAAAKALQAFVRSRLPGYKDDRNEPSAAASSMLSPYLHFGQISALEVALEVKKAYEKSPDSVEGFLEELIVRRELAVNFAFYTPNYGTYEALPAWAQRTLAAHRKDERPVMYSLKQLEQAKTHDKYWNAAMQEMVHTGYMQNYMRMYWGKKVLEWSETPEVAFETLLHLNNKYFLDGRDTNGYTNCAWCFGLHDRPWGERPIFGMIRYMNAAGLERKFNMAAYVEMVEKLGKT